MDKTAVLSERSWHRLAQEEVLKRVEADPTRGLNQEQIALRQKLFGPNVLTPRKGKPAWLRFLLQFNQPLLYILLAAALVTLL